ncbi:MAG: uroporphyrinogen decarboxylase family protein [Bacillota bacterium]
MTHRERVLTALSHREPDRVPLDLGATPVTSLHIEAYRALREFMGLPPREGYIVNRMQQIVLPDDDMLEILDVDVRGIFLGSPRDSLAEDYPDGSYRDMWGVVRVRPPSSHYYDLVGSPFDKEDLTIEDIEAHFWPNPRDPGFFDGLESRCRQLSASDCAIVFNLGASVVQISQFMRGFIRWYEDLILRPKLLQTIMEHITTIYIEMADEVIRRIGNYIDVVFTSDDLGTQENLQFSPVVYRSVIKPYHERIFRFIKSKSNAKLLLHSCGAIFELIDDLVEIGLDILNPVQVSARNMAIERLKERYGDQLAFWGAIDNQRLLPFATPEEIRSNVENTIEVLGRGGGYVLCATHNIQPGTPPENIVAMYYDGGRKRRPPV